MLYKFLLFVGLLIQPVLAVSQAASEEYGSGGASVLSFYQTAISKARGSSCPMHPSCSQYAKLAFQTHNGLYASLLTTDRLMRCGHDLKNYESIDVSDQLLHYDPLVDTSREENHYQFFRQPSYEDSTLFQFLLSKKQYGEARQELWKNIYETRNATVSSVYYYYISKSYFDEENYIELNRFYSQHITSFSSGNYNDSIKLLLSKGYLHLGKPQFAATSLSTLSSEARLSDEANFLSGLVALHQFDMIKTEEAMMRIPASSKYHTWAAAFNDVEKEALLLEKRSPSFAAISSILLPGSGYLVSGQRATAFTSLLINSIFASIAIEAFRNNNNALGYSAAILGSSWYFGSIIGSYNATLKWNSHKREDFIKQKTQSINLH